MHVTGLNYTHSYIQSHCCIKAHITASTHTHTHTHTHRVAHSATWPDLIGTNLNRAAFFVISDAQHFHQLPEQTAPASVMFIQVQHSCWGPGPSLQQPLCLCLKDRVQSCHRTSNAVFLLKLIALTGEVRVTDSERFSGYFIATSSNMTTGKKLTLALTPSEY